MGYVPLSETKLNNLEECFEPGGNTNAKLFQAKVLVETVRRAQAEIERLSAPPKDLSDPYPLEGPNVREQRRWEKLSGWMKGLDRRVTALGGELSVHKQAAQVEGVPSESERLDLHIQVQILETRLTALSETVARNKRDDMDVAATFRKRINALEVEVSELPPAGQVERRAEQQRRTGHGRRDMGNERRVHSLGLARRSDKERRQP